MSPFLYLVPQNMKEQIFIIEKAIYTYIFKYIDMYDTPVPSITVIDYC